MIMFAIACCYSTNINHSLEALRVTATIFIIIPALLLNTLKFWLLFLGAGTTTHSTFRNICFVS